MQSAYYSRNPCGQLEKNTRNICNIKLDSNDVINLLARPADSNGLVIVKLKLKLEHCGHVFHEAIRPDFLSRILSHLKKVSIFIKTL